MREPTDLQPVSKAVTVSYPWGQFIINKWLALFVVAVIITTVGWYTHRTVGRAIKEDLAEDLRTILRADVAALQIWLETQKRTVNAVIAEPEVRAGISGLVEIVKKHGLILLD